MPHTVYLIPQIWDIRGSCLVLRNWKNHEIAAAPFKPYTFPYTLYLIPYTLYLIPYTLYLLLHLIPSLLPSLIPSLIPSLTPYTLYLPLHLIPSLTPYTLYLPLYLPLHLIPSLFGRLHHRSPHAAFPMVSARFLSLPVASHGFAAAAAAPCPTVFYRRVRVSASPLCGGLRPDTLETWFFPKYVPSKDIRVLTLFLELAKVTKLRRLALHHILYLPLHLIPQICPKGIRGSCLLLRNWKNHEIAAAPFKPYTLCLILSTSFPKYGT